MSPRRIAAAAWGVVFVALLFVAGPVEMADLNREQGWPRLESGVARSLGAVLFASGLGVAVYCSGLFARLGRGTPVPFDPPTNLVVSGLYRHSRNPIYVADVMILLGIFLLSGELALLLYALGVGLFLQIFIVALEEPQLRRRFGAPYDEYTQRVPRWLGRSTWRTGTGAGILSGGGEP